MHLISIEDVRFRKHSGIDGRALLRAIFGVMMGKSSSGGASTITQQLAKMLFTRATKFRNCKSNAKTKRMDYCCSA